MTAVPTPCRAVRTLPPCKPFRSRLCRKRKRCHFSPATCSRRKDIFDRSSRENHRLCAGRSCHPAGHDRDARFLWQPGLLCRGFHLYVCGRKHQLVCARCHEWQCIATIQLAVGRAFGAGQRCRDPTKLPDLGRQQRYPSNCPGGTLQQNLADNRSFALASSSFIVQQIVLDGQGNYWVSGVNAGGQAQIYRYRYDTQAAVASGGELVVWAMEDSLLLRETVNTYASEHPEQTVTVNMVKTVWTMG